MNLTETCLWAFILPQVIYCIGNPKMIINLIAFYLICFPFGLLAWYNTWEATLIVSGMFVGASGTLITVALTGDSSKNKLIAFIKYAFGNAFIVFALSRIFSLPISMYFLLGDIIGYFFIIYFTFDEWGKRDVE